MFCGKCGNQVIEGTAFCGKCGAPMNGASPTNGGGPTGRAVTAAAVSPTGSNDGRSAPFVQPSVGILQTLAEKFGNGKKALVAVAAVLVITLATVFTVGAIRENVLEEKAAAEAAQIEEDRIAEAKRIEEERIAEEKRIEEERKAEEQRIENDLTDIESQVNSFASAMNSRNYEYANKYCVPGTDYTKNVFDAADDVDLGFLDNLGDRLNNLVEGGVKLAGYKYALDFDRNDITLNKDAATVNATKSETTVLGDTVAGCQVRMKRIDGTWLIESVIDD